MNGCTPKTINQSSSWAGQDDKNKGRTKVRPLLMTRFGRLHPGAQMAVRPTLGCCPSRTARQNPYANLNGQQETTGPNAMNTQTTCESFSINKVVCVQRSFE